MKALFLLLGTNENNMKQSHNLRLSNFSFSNLFQKEKYDLIKSVEKDLTTYQHNLFFFQLIDLNIIF